MTATHEAKPLTGRIEDAGGRVSLAAYEAAGGYGAARRALTEMSPADVQALVKEANLRGRGARLLRLMAENCRPGWRNPPRHDLRIDG